MHFFLFFLTWIIGIYFFFITLFSTVNAKSAKLKFDGDFEFAEEDDSRTTKAAYKKRWMHDPKNELCHPLNCQKSEICLLEDAYTAVCVSKKELHKSRAIVISKSRAILQRKIQTSVGTNDDAYFDSEDDDEDQDESKCQECSVSKPLFICGDDNRTYSSPCRLEYHNCIHHTYVRINCTNFCPCKQSDVRMHSKRSQLQRNKFLLGKNKSNRDVTLTSQDFNYNNHHYEYFKYSKPSKNRNPLKYDEKQLTYNEQEQIVPMQSAYSQQSRNNLYCPLSSKPAMANRLLDWFSVVMTDLRRRRQFSKARGHFPIGCQSEVRWMFGHLDTDNDGKISLSELYGLEHDQNEPCLKPFLDACDVNSDIFVTGPEWCGCFSKAERSCLAMRKRSSPEVAPNCDSKGYYQSIQCHRSLNLCWCVNRHGIEFAGTRVQGSKPDCDSIINKISSGNIKTNNVNFEDDEDSIQEIEGSADLPLDI